MDDDADWLAGVRADTPGVEHVAHFNNAGSALPTRQVLQATQDYLQLEASIGGYEAAQRCTAELRRPYAALAALLHCAEEEVAIVSSATEAWRQVFGGLPLREGDRLLTCRGEYGSNVIAMLQAARRTGARVEVIPDDAQGDVDLAWLDAACARGPTQPALIAISHIPTGSGRVYDAAGVGRVARTHGVPYLLDATQSVGQLHPMDVSQLGCWWLVGTGRKYLRAPRGSGFLYASREAMERFEPAFMDVHSATWDQGCTTGIGQAGGVFEGSYVAQQGARRYESYEMSFAAKVGLGVAVECALAAGPERCWRRVQRLVASLRAGLVLLDGVRVHDHGALLCGIVTFSKEGQTAEQLRAALDAAGINASVSRVPSTRLLFQDQGVEEVVRASVHYYNDEREVRALLAAVQAA